MKTKITLVLLFACAVITLSFTFSSVVKTKPASTETSNQVVEEQPIGGFVFDDK